MTDPNAGQQQTNPTNAQPPHAATQPDNGQQAQQQQRTPVVVQTGNDPGLSDRLNDMARTLAGLPEQIVNGFREATQPAQSPAQQTPAQQLQSGGRNAQQPGTDTNPPAGSAPQQTADSPKNGPKVSKFAQWWYKR